MDRGAGDGADSAEDSGSSQSYPSTLPGIPKARIIFATWHCRSRCNFYLCVHLRLLYCWTNCLFFVIGYVAVFDAGKCQTVVSTIARANGRGYC